MKAAKAGAPVGLQTGFAHLDHHWGGLLPGQFIEVLGRTGEGKSLKMYAMAFNCKMQDAKVGIFTPELSRHEVKARVHTLASARPDIKKALGLKHSFRNRALLFRTGFNLKSYMSNGYKVTLSGLLTLTPSAKPGRKKGTKVHNPFDGTSKTLRSDEPDKFKVKAKVSSSVLKAFPSVKSSSGQALIKQLKPAKKK